MDRLGIMQDILDERQRQINICKHGSNTNEFDQENTRNDWVGFITAYSGRAVNRCQRNEREKCDFRNNMIKVAALALAAIEAYDQGWC